MSCKSDLIGKGQGDEQVKGFMVVYLAAAASLFLALPCLAQAGTGSGATGTQYETTDTTGYQALEGSTATTPAPIGSTFGTGKEIPGINSGALPTSTGLPIGGTGGLAANSVNSTSLPSGSYTSVFRQVQPVSPLTHTLLRDYL